MFQRFMNRGISQQYNNGTKAVSLESCFASYMSLAKRETVHGKKVYRLLFLSIIFLKKLLFKEKTGKISKVTEPKRKLGDEKCETGFAD